MRTTITFADDVAAAVDAHRRSHHVGVSEAVNELIRAGLSSPEPAYRYVQKTYDLGEPLVDITNIGEVLEYLDGFDDD